MRTLRDALGPIPALDGAACVGKQSLFEVDLDLPVAVMHRHQERALHVCRACPVLEMCREWTIPDPGSPMWAQGGWSMFDVVGLEQRRKREADRKRRRKQEAEGRRLRAEAAALVEAWREVPW